jgi:hypothetical protein
MGNTFTLILDDNYYISEVQDRERAESQEGRKLKLRECEDKKLMLFRTRFPNTEYGIDVCYNSFLEYGNRYTIQGRSLLLTQSSITELDEIGCYGSASDFGEPEKGYKALVCSYPYQDTSSASSPTGGGQKKPETLPVTSELTITLYQRGKSPRDLEIECECKKLSVDNLTVSSNGSVLVNLSADINTISIGRRPFIFDKEPINHFSGLLRITFDDRGEVSDATKQ